MTQTANDAAHWEDRRRQWIVRAEAVVNQIEQWSHAQGWSTSRTQHSLHERELGQYELSLLRVRLPAGEVHIIPVALQVVGADGRVDIEAFPNLNRVKLIGRNGHWEIYTDSNIPLRQPWNAQTFVQLAQDLVA